MFIVGHSKPSPVLRVFWENKENPDQSFSNCFSSPHAPWIPTAVMNKEQVFQFLTQPYSELSSMLTRLPFMLAKKMNSVRERSVVVALSYDPTNQKLKVFRKTKDSPIPVEIVEQ